MGMKLKSVLTAFVVHFWVASVQSYTHLADYAVSSEMNSRSRSEENYQNLFDSMAKNNVKKSEMYRRFLKEEAIRRQQTFDAIKEELQVAQNENARKNRNFNRKSDISEHVMAKKREANKDNVAETDDYNTDNVTYTFPEIRTQDAFQPTLKLLLSQKKHYDRVSKVYNKLRKAIDAVGANMQRSNREYMNDLNGTLIWLGNIIDMDTDSVKKFIFGDVKPDDDDMKIPWKHASSSVVVYHWKSIRKYGSTLKGDEDFIKERNHMLRMADLALKEVNEYKKYVETVLPVFTAAPKYEVFVTNGTNSWKKI